MCENNDHYRPSGSIGLNYISVVSDGNPSGNFSNFLFLQSTTPSTHAQEFGHLKLPPKPDEVEEEVELVEAHSETPDVRMSSA